MPRTSTVAHEIPGKRMRPRRVAQVGQERHVEPVPLLQAQFIQADVGDHALGIDPAILGPLVLDDPLHRLGGDPQAAGHVLGRAADERSEHELLEAGGVGRVFPLERGDDVLAVVAPGTAVEKWTCPPAWRSPATNATRTVTASRSAGPCPNAAVASGAAMRMTPTSNTRHPLKPSGTWTSGASPASGSTRPPSTTVPGATTASTSSPRSSGKTRPTPPASSCSCSDRSSAARPRTWPAAWGSPPRRWSGSSRTSGPRIAGSIPSA